MRVMSRRVSGALSSWPSSSLPRTSLEMNSRIFWGVGSGMLRTAASTVSASMMMALSLLWGRRPS